jgi:hypothetical protein
MALLKYISEINISSPQVLSLFGHLIKSNKQVHDFQYILIHDYLQIKGIEDGIQHVRNVIFETEDAVTLDEAVGLFSAETDIIRAEIYTMLVIISRIDGFLDKVEALIENLSVNCVMTSSIPTDEASETVKKYL